LAAVNVVATEATFHKEFIEKVALPRALETSAKLSSYMGYQLKN
jgi:IclR family transcriptional regulator, pca regulon regulatory protein